MWELHCWTGPGFESAKLMTFVYKGSSIEAGGGGDDDDGTQAIASKRAMMVRVPRNCLSSCQLNIAVLKQLG